MTRRSHAVTAPLVCLFTIGFAVACSDQGEAPDYWASSSAGSAGAGGASAGAGAAGSSGTGGTIDVGGSGGNAGMGGVAAAGAGGGGGGSAGMGPGGSAGGDVQAPNDIFNPQRNTLFATGDVTISGNRFRVAGHDYFPKTDFLTAVPPGTDLLSHTTHAYLSQDPSRKATIRNALLSHGYNSIYVYLLNQGDYHASSDHPENVVTPYGNGGWSFDTAALDQGRVAAWRAELESLMQDHFIKPFLWLAADDSPAIAGASLAQWNTYVQHMVNTFDDLPIVWVLGLEVDEYWSAQEVSERREHLQSVTSRPVGVHLTTSETRVTGSAYKAGFDFIMIQLASPQSNAEYQADVAAFAGEDRPYVAAEFNVSGIGSGAEQASSVTERSKAIGTLIAGVGTPSRVAGIGNGIELD